VTSSPAGCNVDGSSIGSDIQTNNIANTVTARPRVAPARWIAATIRTLVFSLLAMVLFACRQSSREPVTLRFTHGWASRPDELSNTAALSEQFTRETGIGLRHIPSTDNGNSLDALDLHRRLLQEGSAGTDLLAPDVIWSPMIESDLIDLRPYLAAEISLLEPQLLPAYTVNGKLVAVPYEVNVGALEYRPDLLREYRYHHPPKTWDELETMAARIQAGERAKGKKDFWGYVWQGAPTEALTCNALEWQVSEGGGQIIESDRTISVNNPAAIRTWQRAKHWIGWISPPSVVAYRERDSMSVFDAGRAAFDRIWLGTTIARSGRSRQLYWRGSLPIMKTGYTSMPGGSGTLGGSGLSISRYTVHPQEAIELVRFLTRAQIQSGIPEGLAAQPELYDPPSMFEGSDQHVEGAVTRPSNVVGGTYEEASKVYIGAVYSVLTGRKGASQAAAELEKQLVQITGFSSRRPKTVH
jgi:trehalose/maltose transport system substrate-binding protein